MSMFVIDWWIKNNGRGLTEWGMFAKGFILLTNFTGIQIRTITVSWTNTFVYSDLLF